MYKVFCIKYSGWKNTRYLILNTRYSKTNGFTLIEFLVVIGMLSLTVGSILLFLTSILKGSNQASVTAELKQNMQGVLDNLEKQIRNATDVECKNSSGTPVFCSDQAASKQYLKLIRPGDDPLHIKCFPSGASTNGRIATIATTDENPGDSLYVNLTNTDPTSGVNIDCTNSQFKVLVASPGETAPKIVSVILEADQGIGAPSRKDFRADVKFDTTVSLRGY